MSRWFANRRLDKLVLPLIQTLTDIALLRRGPESIPRAGIVLVMILGLYLLSMLAALALLEHYDEADFYLTLLLAVIAIAAYTLLVMGFGHPDRVLQTISAILGCGALISFVYIAAHTLLLPFVGALTTAIITQLIAFWAVPVEGHIIARAISQHWYVGIVIAIGIYVFQILLYGVLSPAPST